MARHATVTVTSTAVALADITEIAADLSAANVQSVYIQVQTNALRTVLDNGEDPTTTEGRLWTAPAGFTVTTRADINAFRMCSNGTDAEVYIELGR